MNNLSIHYHLSAAHYKYSFFVFNVIMRKVTSVLELKFNELMADKLSADFFLYIRFHLFARNKLTCCTETII